MSDQQQPGKSSVIDTLKLILSISLLVAGIAGFYYFSAYPTLYRVLGILVIGGVSVGIVLTTAIGRLTASYLKESRQEVRKVIWPTRQETMQSTLVVVALVFVVGLILWLLDMVLFWGVGLLTGQRV
ncbi:preprotein translocase subunit SecE [Candidatus Methylospira mobilis]|uniref:Protein translocase subunit SecE n=1 Tax=Candidatus Methylospira mobilis TaxID=1808979 RepID=A0A5Q0BIV3_9GAMM|nr:preprotein translocase subunit SecE [Candidatus Methylospira mobilis]QFY43750.1 preprotein translocase subunit SecE [Candidatus Methylospira mobilis]WNV04739.1 preprotein translocase subunit SecE [Candidatus Methylospira mobilis]